MSEFNGVTVISVPSLEGPETVDILVSEIEGGTLGMSLTERNGLSMRRVAIEMSDIEDIKAIHNALGTYLTKHQ